MAKDENQQGYPDVMDQLQTLCQRIDNECPNSLLQSLKALEKQETELRSQRSSNCSRLQHEIDELDKMLHDGRNNKDSDKLHHSLEESNLKLESAKLELGEKLSSILSLKREFDDVASPAELIQYELRFTELNTQIQKKLQQTRKHYDTYNALLDIKELMLKEISLLNSISLQFQSAITSADGRIKLINSLEGILNGTQQKLDKVELGLKSEQKLFDSIKEKYVAVISEQRQSSSLLKLLQEECARNDRLQTQIHQHAIWSSLKKDAAAVAAYGGGDDESVKEFNLVGLKVVKALKEERKELKGRVSFFSRSNCRDSGAVRAFLRKRDLNFVEINVDVYPSREKELRERTGAAAVPQIFFNEKLIGGLVVLNSLRNGGMLEAKMDEILGRKCPDDASAEPIYGFGEVEDEAVEGLGKKMMMWRLRWRVMWRGKMPHKHFGG